MNLCYLCSGTEFFDVEERHIISDMMDYNWSDGMFRVVMCENCGLVQNLPRPTIAEIGKIYENDIMFDSRLRKIEPPTCYYPATPSAYKEQLSFITGFWSLSGKKILEIGPGDGYFLNLVSDSGAKVSAVEPNVEMATFLQNKGFEIINDIFENAKIEKKFDFLVARHVFEHTLDPMLFLAKIKECLATNGQVYIEVPNVMATKAHDIESQFTFQHLWTFSFSMLKLMFEKAGFEIIASDEMMHPPVIRVIAKISSNIITNEIQAQIDENVLNVLRCYKKKREELINHVVHKLNSFSRKHKGKKILLHGASYHAIELLFLAPEFKFDSILDILPCKQGKMFMGQFRVIHPDNCVLENSAVVIASAISAEDIQAYWLTRGLDKENILNLYEDWTVDK